MKPGDVVQYARPDVEKDIGVVVTIYPTSGREIVPLVDVLWDNGIWTDDASEFKVIDNESR